MQNTLIRSQDKYYKYNGVAGNNTVTDKDIGLAIGGYKSAFQSDIVASCLFKMTTEHFTHTIIQGIYRDNGLVVFNGYHSP
eukprot:9946172-Ditylum_brightwellii.AAC.1